jgi:DNA mismatch endonuclease (patch repair protein)
MSRIRGRDSAPELRVRRGLHAKGLRFRLHVRSLPGRPDLVLPKHRTVVFVHGCFWHAHGCSLSKVPASRAEFWKNKLEGNAARDRRVIEGLRASAWSVLVIWECALRGRFRIGDAAVFDKAASFIRKDIAGALLEIAGDQFEESSASPD